MDERINFINRHPEIKRIVLLVGKDYSYETLKSFIDKISISKLYLVGNLSKHKILEIETFFERDFQGKRNGQTIKLEYIRSEDFDGLGGSWALCSELFDLDDIRVFLNSSKNWKPAYLSAMISESYATAFKIWETFKERIEYIQIITFRQHKEPQILEWENKNEIELSIIFPMYKVEKYLDECINSVTAWKAPYVEFLFVNDGSPDHSRDIVLKWAKNDARIKLIDKDNGGCASARQRGLECAKGKYIGFVDPDDFVDESMFRKLLRAAMTGSYDVSYCGYNEFYEDTKTTKQVDDPLDWPYCDGCVDENRIRELMMFSRVAIWRGIYKKEMIERNGIHFYTDIKRFDDLPFKVEVFSVAKSVASVPEHLYYYRLSRPGQDVSADDDRLYVHFDIFNHLNQSIGATYNARLIDYLQICKIQTHLYALEKIKPEFRDTYLEKAKGDLLSMCDEERTYKIAEHWIGEKKAKQFKAIIEKRFNDLFEEE